MLTAAYEEFRVLLDGFREICPHCGERMSAYDYRRSVCDCCGYMEGPRTDALQERRDIYAAKRRGDYASRFIPRYRVGGATTDVTRQGLSIPSPWYVLLVVLFIPIWVITGYLSWVLFVSFAGMVVADRVERWGRDRPRDQLGSLQLVAGDVGAWILTTALLFGSFFGALFGPPIVLKQVLVALGYLS